MEIGFCWVMTDNTPADCDVTCIQPGDTVTLNVRADLEDEYLLGKMLRVRVEVVNGDEIEGRLDLNGGVHSDAHVTFRKTYVIGCSKTIANHL